jgi:hypothetical protein
MGVETLIPPKMITAAAPDGAPPRRIKTVEIIICRFSWRGGEPDRSMSVSTEQNLDYIQTTLSELCTITMLKVRNSPFS